jgi:hypothetical protein
MFPHAALLALQLNALSLSYHAPAALADTTHDILGALVNPCGAGLNPEAFPLTINLYWALAYQPSWSPVYLRSHLVQPGAADTFLVDASRAATYWVEPMNAAGAGCRTGYTVGVPAVDVPLVIQHWRRSGWRRFDLQGRRMEIGPSGQYYGGAGDTTVIH